MFRDGTADNAAWIMLSQNDGVLSFEERPATGQSETGIAQQSATNAPVWLKLQRSGNVFTAWSSSDGVSWTKVGSKTLALNTILNVGLAVDSYTSNTLNTAVFNNVSLTGQAPAAPAPTITPIVPGGATVEAGGLLPTRIDTDPDRYCPG